MSYSLSAKCANCKKGDKCIDRHVVYGAICGIHSVNCWSFKENKQINNGHLGWGVIEIQCGGFEAEEDTGRKDDQQ